MEKIDLLEKNLNKENSKENKVKLKLKEYFIINEKLFHENFNSFLEFIGLSDIWSTEKEKNILWDTIMAKATDKENIDYDAASSVISTFLDEDDNCEIDDIFDDKIDNINIKDINLDNSDLNLFGPHNDKENKNNEINENGKSLDEFLNTFNDKQDNLYYIRFINEIFFNNSNITNFDFVYEDKNGDNEKIKINYDELQNKIKNEYNFINIREEVLKNYLNNIKVIGAKIEDKNEISKNTEYYLDKKLIKYTNAIIDLKIGENNKNNINTNINNNLNSNEKSNNINSIELNIGKLASSDKNIISCINGAISLNSNSDFLKIAKIYIENYIINFRKSVYEEMKSKELEYEQKIKSTTSSTCNIYKKSIEIENKKLNEEMKNFLKRNSKLTQLNKNKSSYKMINLNEIMEKDENSSSVTLRSSLSMPRKNSKISQNIIISNKNKLNMPQKSTDNLLILKSETNVEKAKSRLKLMQQNKNITGLNKSIYSTVDGYANNADVTNSRIDLFSNKGNINKDQFLLDTTGLYTEVLEDDDKTTNNNKKDKNNLRLINKDEISKKNTKDPRKSYNNIMDIFSENNDFDYEDIDDNFYNGKIHSSNNFFLKKKTMDDNYINTSDFLLGEDENFKNPDLNIFQSLKSLDNCYNTFAYGPLNARSMSKISQIYGLEDNNYINMNRAINNFYDYKYLSNSNKVKKILALNNEKINLHEFFTEEIYSYFCKAKKEKCVLIITSHSFYFLKSDSLECVFRTNLKLLESLTISSNNFNLLLVSFKGGKDIIIESLQRIQILIFIKRVLLKRNLDNQIKVSSSNKFCLRKSNGKKETILTFKNKMFNLTPNFENAQKVGLLLKYQETMFSARFNEKLVALCSIGLVYFSDNCKVPKEIIPLIGTAIKPIIVMQGSDKIYCLKFTTINEEKYIFGSLIKRELLDWKKEISYFIKMYNIQMKSINPNFSRKSSKFNEKGNEDIFENNHDK